MTLLSRKLATSSIKSIALIMLALVCVAGTAYAQNPINHVPTADEGLVTAPEQLRRAEPPSKDAAPELLEEQGDTFRREKAYADALDYYSAAFQKRGTAQLQNKIGITHLQMMRDDQARKSFERALKLDKAYAEAQNNLGVVHYRKKNYRRAIRAYKKAIELKPDNASFYSNLGTAEFAREKFDDAVKAYLKALELDPTIFERRANNGVSAHLAFTGDRAKYHFVIAKMYAKAGDPDRSLLYLRKALEEGYPSIKDAYRLEEFAGLRKDPRFEAVMQQPVPGSPAP